jgi:FMN-dependent NADH-azoreductase
VSFDPVEELKVLVSKIEGKLPVDLLDFFDEMVDFYKENGIVPSFKTIEANLIEKNLPLIDKNFINNVFRKSNYPAKIFDEEVKFDLEKLFKNKI